MKGKEWAQKEVDRYLSYEGVNEARNALVFAKGVIDQLDEPEVLSQEWMKDNQLMKISPEGVVYYVPVENLQNLLVPKQELPVIPQFVADWIDDLKSKEIHLLESIYDFTHGEDINDYMREQGSVLLRAWLDGFTVEKEQKYYAKIKGHELVIDREDYYWNVDGDELYIDNNWHDYSGYKTTKLTKCDWNNLGINEDNADFVKVEEVE